MRISVNGIPLLNMEVTGQCSSTWPFNHLILASGMVSVKYEALPLRGKIQLQPDAYLRCVVELYDKDSNNYQPVSTMASYETPPRNETILPYLVHEEFFHASVPYSMIGWKQSIRLDHFQNRLRPQVLSKYNSIIDMMRNHRFSQYEDAFRERENIIGVCFYMPEDEKRERMEAVKEAIMNSTAISPLTERDFLEFAADGRLVRLIKADGESSLRVRNDVEEEETILDLWLHMKPGRNELTII